MCFQLENFVKKKLHRFFVLQKHFEIPWSNNEINDQSRWSNYVHQCVLLKAAHTPHDGTKIAEPLGSQAVARRNAAKKQA